MASHAVVPRLPAIFVSVCFVCVPTQAQDAYYSVPVGELRVVDGDAAALVAELNGWIWHEPSIRVDGGARAFLNLGPDPSGWATEVRLLVRAPKGAAVKGSIASVAATDGARVWSFEIAADRADPQEERAFTTAERDHYARLLARGVAGGAWFRHRVTELSAKLGEPAPIQRQRGGGDFGDDAFEMFTAGRALAENLQLDRAMNVGDADAGGEVALDSLPGIDVREFDWKELTAKLQPALDPLARCIPFDQHAFFVPDLARAARLLREADQYGAPVLEAMEPRCQDEGLLRRYEDQLGVRASELAAIVGKGAGSAVLTGSDISFRMGTDVALVLEVDDPPTALAALWGHMSKTAGDAADTGGEHVGVRFAGRASRDRRVSRYAVALDGAVAIGNSKAQIARLIDVHRGAVATLASLPEYRYFRDRYARGGDESGFAMLTDATIRRWCGARWRVGEYRRLRALARLLELTSQHAEALVRRTTARQDLVVPGDEVWLDDDGVHSSRWGSLSFCTPVIELAMDSVSGAEANAYGRWRDSYQRNWSQFFDPIAVRVRVDDEVLAADVSVMPLIAASEYRKSIEVSLGAKIDPAALDAHPVLARMVMAINPASRPFKMGTRLAASMAPGLDVDPLAWMGQTVSLFVDADPLWQELGAAEDPEKFMEANWHRLAIGLEVEVKSALRLTAFLAGLRAFVEDTAPEMTSWAAQEHNGKKYVRIGPSEAAKRDLREMEKVALFYAVSGKRLLLSLNEQIVQRALDREAAPAGGATAELPLILGDNMALHMSPSGVQALRQLGLVVAQGGMRHLSFQNLPILDEWKRIFPDLDPVEVHERLFKVRPVCPGGGQYLCNDAMGITESTAYGSPFAPRPGPAFPPIVQRLTSGDFGLTFDPNGLRARATLRRK